MWPSVPAYRCFGNIPCPSGSKCDLPHCIFNHEIRQSPAILYSPTRAMTPVECEPEAKRVKLSPSTLAPVEEPDVEVPSQSNVFVGSILNKEKPTLETNPKTKHVSNEKVTVNKDTHPPLPKSAVRPVSPPPTASAAAKPAPNPDAPVSLMPRKLGKEPATFTKRVTLLKALHMYMKPHNDKMTKAVKPDIKALHLTPNQLNKLAVDEEARIAQENSSVYENVLKQRLVKLKGMTPEQWVKERKEAVAKEKGEPPRKPPLKRIDTGLTPKEEIACLSLLKCPQDGLDAHGYVTKLPTESEVTEARLTLEAAGHWEECDRCSTRFQVFPDRREEDGALTSGGQCRHHWGKRIFPKRSKGAAPQPTRLTCCNEEVGAPGCTTTDTHVFSVKNAKRLSLVMPFIETPPNDQAPPHTAVCFDCEMGYTTNGLEMLRLTVISWPMHKPLVDVLVKPLGHILDVNTRFSGVTAEQFVNAKAYDPANPKPMRHDLCIVESPYAARDLFLSLVSPETPVLGHALENDLNTIRLIHPNIIDTVLLYPTRQGLPYRHGLRNLAKMHLGEEIQQAGAAGHDSYEDARTTGELIRNKVKQKWELLKIDGWTIQDDGVYPPVPKGTPPVQVPTAPSMVPMATMAMLEGKPAEKRKLGDAEGEDAEPGTKKQS
ncbi:RNA exonuclease 3 [Coniothyrium glycines]